MSVIVKGMEIPESCRECPFENYYSDTGKTVCMASLRVLAIGFGIISFDGRHSSCPIVALPDKHGRLVDADATIKEIKARNPDDVTYEDAWAITCIEHATTIVEAEGDA